MLPCSQSEEERRAAKTRLLQETLQLNESVMKTQNHLLWGFVNVAGLAALVYNILNTAVDYSITQSILLYQAQRGFAVLLTISLIFHFAAYSFQKMTVKPVFMSPRQRKMLGVRQNDNLFPLMTSGPSRAGDQRKEPVFTSMFPMNLSNTSCLSPAINETGNAPRPSLPDQSQWAGVTSYPVSVFPEDNVITDELSLSRYLEAVDEHERRSAVAASVEVSPTSYRSFWTNKSPHASPATEVSPVLRRTHYQMSPLSSLTPNNSPNHSKHDDGASPVAISHTELWRRVKIDPAKLTQWNANLRMWISLTILQRVVEELDHIDAAFVRCGLSDLHLGSVGLDRLKRTAGIPQVVSSIPSLPRLVPFLELSQHQEYLVTRIRELAKGGSMSEFRWNSGGSVHGKPWEEHLPTDSALIMHVIVTYLDLQLMAPSQRADGSTPRLFSAQHFVRSPERPPLHPHGLTIHQPHINPPHFMLIDKDEAYDVPPGRNNIFYTFLLFLHLLKTREHGMLGPLNLGRSGVNVLWVVDS